MSEQSKAASQVERLVGRAFDFMSWIVIVFVLLPALVAVSHLVLELTLCTWNNCSPHAHLRREVNNCEADTGKSDNVAEDHGPNRHQTEVSSGGRDVLSIADVLLREQILSLLRAGTVLFGCLVVLVPLVEWPLKQRPLSHCLRVTALASLVGFLGGHSERLVLSSFCLPTTAELRGRVRTGPVFDSPNVKGNWAAARNLNLQTTAGWRLQLTDLLGLFMDSSYLRAIASQLETTAKVLRQMADGQDAAQAVLAANCDVLNKPFESVLSLNVLSQKACHRIGVETVGDLIRKTPDDLLSVLNFGCTSLNCIRVELAKHGLALSGDA